MQWTQVITIIIIIGAVMLSFWYRDYVTIFAQNHFKQTSIGDMQFLQFSINQNKWIVNNHFVRLFTVLCSHYVRSFVLGVNIVYFVLLFYTEWLLLMFRVPTFRDLALLNNLKTIFLNDCLYTIQVRKKIIIPWGSKILCIQQRNTLRDIVD